MYASDWKTATIDIDRATEFSGDDVDRFSSLVDLGDNYEFLTVFVPTLTSAVVSVYVQRDDAIATVPAILNALDADATGSFAHSTTAGTGGVVVTFRIGGCRYLRVHTGANQAADRSLVVRGFNRTVYGA